MALPNYGSTIRMSQINVELDRTLNTTISLNDAEKGNYATLEIDSVWRPKAGSSAPRKMSGWFGYDHSAERWLPGYSILHDGINDWTRWTGDDWTKIAKIFQNGGTIALAFQCTGETAETNQYLIQGGWGGGNNWLLQIRDFSSNAFQARFRHDFSTTNLISECATSSGQRPFSEDRWHFLCMTYNNSSTSNKPSWYYAAYADSSVTAIGSSPYMDSSPAGAYQVDTSSSAEFPALSGGRGAVTRPFQGYITLVGMWDRELSSAEVDTLFNGGLAYQFSQVNNGQQSKDLLQFHDMASISLTTMSPETTMGGIATGYDLLLVNGASQDTEYPS